MKYLSIFVVFLTVFAGPSLADAKAPAGRFVVDAKGETVFDSWTKRTWQRAVVAGNYSQATGKTYCNSLTLAGGGWHLPNILELQSIVDRQQTGPAIDPSAFPATPAAAFWSATPFAGLESMGWYINFDTGEHSYNMFGSSEIRVRCVR